MAFENALERFWLFIPSENNVGLLGGLLSGDYTTISRDNQLAQSALEMENFTEDMMAVNRETEDIINMQRSVAFRHIGLSPMASKRAMTWKR
mgnify:FL=1